MMTPLERYPKVRTALYDLQWVVNGALGLIAVIVLALQGELPLWLTITTAAFNFVWAYTGITARQNVEPADDPAGEDWEV